MGFLLKALLRLYPRAFRQRYGQDMLRQLHADLAEARDLSLFRGVVAAARHLVDFVVAGLAQRLATLPRAPAWSRLGTDLRHVLRSARRRPGFTVSAVVILTLGVAVNVSVFSMAVSTLRPGIGGVKDSDRLVSIFQFHGTQGYHSSLSLPAWGDYGAGIDALEELAVHSGTWVNLTLPDESRRIRAHMVSRNYFRVLGVQPSLGRSFVADGNGEGEARSLVLSHSAWQRHFGGRPGILGTTVRLGDEAFTVVGVAPEEFTGLDLEQPADVWVTLEARDAVTTYPDEMVQRRTMHWLTSVGRLADGVGLPRARAEATALAGALAAEYPDEQGEWEARVLPLAEALIWPGERERVEQVALMLGAVVLLILLLACTTLASMTLADVADRRHEAAVRLALGAGRRHLVRHELLRALLITALALALGLVGGDLLVRGATAWGLIPGLPPGLDLRPDARTLVAVCALIPVLTLVVGLLPALHAGASRPASTMGSRWGGGLRVGRLRRVLSALQVGISVAVLSAAGSLLLDAHARLSHELGFDADGVLLASVAPNLSGYDGEARRVFYLRARDLLAELPGVRSAAVSAFVPLSGPRLGAQVGFTDTEGAEGSLRVTGNIVSEGYFETMGIPVTAGRAPEDGSWSGPIPLVINEAAAHRLWGGADPLGREVDLGAWLGGRASVVGVAGNLGAGRSLFAEPQPSIFLPLEARPWVSATLHVKVDGGSPTRLVEEVRQAMASLDPAVPVYDVRTLEDVVSDARAPAIATAGAVGLLGVLGLLLAAAGIYGVVAQAVSRRRHEFGVRVAVGAGRRHVLGHVLREGAVILGGGVLLGIPSALVLARLLETGLFGVDPMSPATLSAAVLVTCGGTVAALLVPARKATTVDPVEALRPD